MGGNTTDSSKLGIQTYTCTINSNNSKVNIYILTGNYEHTPELGQIHCMELHFRPRIVLEKFQTKKKIVDENSNATTLKYLL